MSLNYEMQYRELYRALSLILYHSHRLVNGNCHILRSLKTVAMFACIQTAGFNPINSHKLGFVSGNCINNLMMVLLPWQLYRNYRYNIYLN